MSGNGKLSSVALATGIVVLVLCLAYAESSALHRVIGINDVINTEKEVEYGFFLREAKEPKSTPKPSFCHRSTPCGWSVYTPFTKEIEYFMPNTCICKEGLDCIRTENDISISAFVHNCRDKSEPTGRIFS